MARSAYVVWTLLSLSGFAWSFEADFFSAPTLTYPVVTHSMTSAVGEIDEPLSYQPLQSIAIVGADELSARWLRLNNDYLLKIGALGLVVNVESVAQLEVLRRYTDIPLIASPGDSLAVYLGHVYPILVDATSGRIRQ